MGILRIPQLRVLKTDDTSVGEIQRCLRDLIRWLEDNAHQARVSASDTIARFLVDKLRAGANITITREIDVNGEEVLVIAGTGGGMTDELIKITASDTTAGYLNSKLAVSTGIQKTTLNPGANEQLQISVTSAVVLDTDANTYTAGQKQSVQHDATNAGFRLVGAAGDPSSLSNGDLWYDSTGNKFRARENGASVDLIGAGGGAPTNAEYVVGALNGTLSAERLGTTTSTIAWDFGTAGQAKLNVVANSIGNTEIRQGGATSVVGRSANSTGNVADIAASADNQFLSRHSGSLGFAAIVASDLPSAVVLNNQANTYTSGSKQSVQHSATTAGFRLVGTAGDPSTPADGDVWYDSTAAKFRARQNGSSVDMIGGGGGGAPTNAQYLVLALDGTLSAERVLVMDSSQFTLTDGGANGDYTVALQSPLIRTEYVNELYNIPTDGTLSEQATGSNSGCTAQAGQGDHPGIVRISTGTTATGRCNIICNNLSSIIFGGSSVEYTFEAIANVITLSTGTQRATFQIGFYDTLNANSTDGAYFRYVDNVNSGKWQAVTVNNTTETSTDTGITAAAGTWVNFKIVMNGAGTSCAFSINGSVVATNTTNIPTSAGRELTFGVGAWASVGTTAKTMDVDLIRLVQRRTSGSR